MKLSAPFKLVELVDVAYRERVLGSSPYLDGEFSADFEALSLVGDLRNLIDDKIGDVGERSMRE